MTAHTLIETYIHTYIHYTSQLFRECASDLPGVLDATNSDYGIVFIDDLSHPLQYNGSHTLTTRCDGRGRMHMFEGAA